MWCSMWWTSVFLLTGALSCKLQRDEFFDDVTVAANVFVLILYGSESVLTVFVLCILLRFFITMSLWTCTLMELLETDAYESELLSASIFFMEFKTEMCVENGWRKFFFLSCEGDVSG